MQIQRYLHVIRAKKHVGATPFIICVHPGMYTSVHDLFFTLLQRSFMLRRSQRDNLMDDFHSATMCMHNVCSNIKIVFGFIMQKKKRKTPNKQNIF